MENSFGMVRIKNGKERVVLNDEDQDGLNLLKILNEVEKEYSEQIGCVPRDFDNWRVFVKYRTILVEIAKYLVVCNNQYCNRTEDVAADYFRSIYRMYTYYGKLPYIRQLSVNGSKNLMYHDEFIQKYEQEYGAAYWQTNPISEERLKAIADIVERHKNDEYPETEQFDVEIYDI